MSKDSPLWVIKARSQSPGLDIFGPEKEILPFAYDMRHIIIGAVAPVANKDGFSPG